MVGFVSMLASLIILSFLKNCCLFKWKIFYENLFCCLNLGIWCIYYKLWVDFFFWINGMGGSLFYLVVYLDLFGLIMAGVYFLWDW